MRINILGGGPAGLYFARLAKQLDPALDIRVYERNPRGATYGFGVVFQTKALRFIEEGDPEVFAAMAEAMERWDDQTIARDDDKVAVDGNGFTAIARLTLLEILERACEEVGVTVEHECEIGDIGEVEDCDLLVGADGGASILREARAAHFQPSVEHLTNRFAWYGTRQPFDTLTLTFRDHPTPDGGHGAYVAHHYRYQPDLSTFIVECDAETFNRSGLAEMSPDEQKAHCEAIFAPELGGHPLIENRSIWRQFPVLTNAHWTAGNAVLIGDALRTVHFSIGSGTRLALEDSIALARAFSEEGFGDVPKALARFEADRRPVVEKILAAASRSYTWYETFDRKMDLDAVDLAYDYMTRSGRVDDAKLREIAPRFMQTVADRHAAAE